MMKYLSKARQMENYGMGVSVDHQALCSVCNKNPAQIFFNEHPLFRTNCVFPCPDCFKEVEGKTSDWYEKNATSVWKDNKNGQEVAVDQRGKIMPNPYEYKNRAVDPHGWLKTDKRAYKKNLEKKGII